MDVSEFQDNLEERSSFELLKKDLKKHFKQRHFTRTLQGYAIVAILKREQDVYVSMPPGCRKSLCYQLPGVMQDDKVTVVFSPFIGRVRDQMDYLTKHKIRTESINSRMSEKGRNRISIDLRSKNPSTRILFVTPEEAATESFRSILKSLHEYDRLAYFVVNEAHCVSQLSHDYRHDYLHLAPLRSTYPDIPWIALTVPTTQNVFTDIVDKLQLRRPIASFKTCFLKNLFYDVVFKNSIAEELSHLKEFITECLETTDEDVKQTKKPCGIIHCRSSETAERIARGLTTRGITTKAFHSALSPEERNKVQEDWMAGKYPVICATNIHMIADKSAVRFVVHWEVPQSTFGYYQETGKAGRDGQKSFCRIYYCKNDVATIDLSLKSNIAKAKDGDTKKAKCAYEDFLEMCKYCETVACRHAHFSNYLGDRPSECKRRCDVCKYPTETNKALVNFHRLSTIFSSNGDTSTGNGSDVQCGPTIEDRFEGYEGNNGQCDNHSTRVADTSPEKQFDSNHSESSAQMAKEHERRSPGHLGVKVKPEPFSNKLFQMKTKPPLCVSPTKTIIKEEVHSPTTAEPPRCASSTNVTIKEEHQRPLRTNSSRCISPATTIIEGEVQRPLRTKSSRCISPATTIIEEEVQRPLRTASSRCISPATTIIKGEVQRPLRSARTDTLSGISSTSTIIKGEHIQFPRCSDELFEMQTRPPRNVSPANTIIKDEPVEELHQMDTSLDCNGVDLVQIWEPTTIADSSFLSSTPTQIQAQQPQIEIEYMNLQNTSNSSGVVGPIIKAEPNSPPELANICESPVLFSSDAHPIYDAATASVSSGGEPPCELSSFPRSNMPTTTIIKSEPSHQTSVLKSATNSKNDGTSSTQSHTTVKAEPTSPVLANDSEDILDYFENLSNNSLPSRTPSTERASGEYTSKRSKRKRHRSRSNEKRVIKREKYDYRDQSHETLSSRKKSHKSRHSKKQRKEFDVSDEDRRTRSRKRNRRIKVERHSSETELDELLDDENQSRPLSTSDRNHQGESQMRIKRSSSGSATEIDETVDSATRRHRSPLPSTSTSRKTSRWSQSPESTPERRNSKHKRSKDKRDRKHKSKKRMKMERDSSENEREVDNWNTNKYHSLRRSTSTDRRNNFSPESSPNRRKSKHSKSTTKVDDYGSRSSGRRNKNLESKISKYDRRRRSERHSSASETEIDERMDTHPDDYQSPEASSSKNNKRKVDDRWSSIRFSASPVSSPERHRSEQSSSKNDKHDRWSSNRYSTPEIPQKEQNDSDDMDYGWKYPAPPKEEPKVEPKSIYEEPALKARLKKFDQTVNTEFDLDVIKKEGDMLLRAIHETIDAASKAKVTELDRAIQKKKDDYLRKLFGADNFDAWDNDPALSNVKMAKKLQPYKSLMPDDAPLLEKITLKTVINSMRLTPARERSELVFHGQIKRIETEFQGQELPPALLKSIKQEKSIIADLVKKSLMPYYNTGKIQSSTLFTFAARQISHVFYDRFANEKIIKNYIDGIFEKLGTLTNSRDLETAIDAV